MRPLAIRWTDKSLSWCGQSNFGEVVVTSIRKGNHMVLYKYTLQQVEPCQLWRQLDCPPPPFVRAPPPCIAHTPFSLHSAMPMGAGGWGRSLHCLCAHPPSCSSTCPPPPQWAPPLPTLLCTWVQVVGEAHRDALLSMSGLNRALHALVTEMRRVCEEVRSSSQRCVRAVDAASSQLQQSFISHQQACR